MMRWKVRRSPNGDWWAHDPLCPYRGGLLCIIFGQCTNCGSFKKAFMYAETKARMEFVPQVPILPGRSAPIIRRSHNSL